MSRSLKIAAALAALTLPVAAHATVTVTSTGYGLTAPAGPGPLVTFDGEGGGFAGFTLGGTLPYGTQMGTSPLPGAAPYDGPVNGADMTNYLTVPTGGLASLTSAAAYTTVSLFWGSIDNYNAFNLLDSSGNIFETITSSTLGVLSSGNGDQTAADTNRRVTITSDTPFYGVSFGSQHDSFEADNIKFTSAVPEPATWMMMLFGFGFMGAAMRKAKRKQGSAASFA